MTEKCFLCGDKIGESFLGKLNGTIISVSKNTATGKEYICSDCQKKYKDNLKEVVEKEK
ncbi:MAG: hypothetical protein AABX03_00515 [Nanoarchaeota archaeon]